MSRGVESVDRESVSQSGATVFVEPEETIPLNNELTRLSLAERDEEQRVLGELTDRVREVRAALEELVEGLGALDLVFARAALAERIDASEPRVEPDGDLDLNHARHPLLVAQRWGGTSSAGDVVPIDLRVPADRPRDVAALHEPPAPPAERHAQRQRQQRELVPGPLQPHRPTRRDHEGEQQRDPHSQ